MLRERKPYKFLNYGFRLSGSVTCEVITLSLWTSISLSNDHRARLNMDTFKPCRPTELPSLDLAHPKKKEKVSEPATNSIGFLFLIFYRSKKLGSINISRVLPAAPGGDETFFPERRDRRENQKSFCRWDGYRVEVFAGEIKSPNGEHFHSWATRWHW